MSQAANKTVDFVKQWVYGLYTKRQYQNWYIVKTEHSEFLLTLTEKRELYAIKDRKSGHVYILDDDLKVDENGTIDDEVGMDNPFLCLLKQMQTGAFTFPAGYTRLGRHSGMGPYYPQLDYAIKNTPNAPRNIISKFRVCERIEFEPAKYGEKTYISLIAIGDRRFYTMPTGMRKPNKSIPLAEWASFLWEASFDHGSNWHHYRLTECLNRSGIEKVSDIRSHYLELAGDQAPNTRVDENGWISIPQSNVKTMDDIAGFAFLEARKSRPNPFHYNISPSISDYSKLSRRHETIAENGEFLKDCLSLDGDKEKDFHSSNWEAHLQKFLPNDLATDYISYFKADDAWLEKHRDVARASYLEYALRHNQVPVSGWLLVQPGTDLRFGPYEIYMRDGEFNFKRLVPAPRFHATVFANLMGGHKVED